MKFEILSNVVEELSAVLPGARVDRVFETEEKSILIIFHKSGMNRCLLIRPDRSLPRLHLVAQKPAAGPSLHPFSQYLKSRVTGARIECIGLLNRDRIAEIRLTRDGTEYRLIFELTGSAANVIMTGIDGTILAVYYPAIPQEGVRILIPGVRYELPPRKDPGDRPSRASSARPLDRPDTLGANRDAELYYDRVVDQKKFEASKARLRALINKLSGRAERKLQALSADESAARSSERYKRAGDLILANLHCLRTGMSQAELSGFDGDDKQLVPLDPKRTPAGNAERYFKKYKKAKSGLSVITARLQEVLREKSLLLSFLGKLEKAEAEADIASIRAHLIEQGYASAAGKRERKREAVPPGQPFRTLDYCGWEIMIGKNAVGNDYITMNVAGNQDIWLHAEGLPGSHVVVRNPQKKEVPPDVLRKAASLAAFYSKGRSAKKISVAYTFARHVRKPRGAKAGLVTLQNRKTIMVEPQKE